MSGAGDSGSLSPTTPTLRRKRSSANAALTSRPSSLSLRDANANGGSPLVGTPFRLTSVVPTLNISLSTLVLVHTTTDPAGRTSLAHALFTPDFLVEGSGHSRRLGREAWERVRDTVEGMRIIGRRRSSAASIPASPGLATSGLGAFPASPNGKSVPGVSSSTRWFSVAPEEAAASSRSISTLFIQPGPLEGLLEDEGAATPTSSIARCAADLMTFQVHGVGDDAAEVSADAWAKLPMQLRSLLQEAEALTGCNASARHDAMDVDIDDADDGNDVCDAVLALLQL